MQSASCDEFPVSILRNDIGITAQSSGLASRQAADGIERVAETVPLHGVLRDRDIARLMDKLLLELSLS